MSESKLNCERPCDCRETPQDVRFIVLTGGPGAGKTAVLELVRKVLCAHVAILPEAASIVYGGGFWRLPSPTAKAAAQRAIFHVQTEMERLVLDEGRWAVGLCDRGSIDGLAYWPGSERRYWETLETTREQEISKYHAVIHLRCPSLENGYNHSNPLRIESANEAAKIDARIAEVWGSHPRYRQIDSSSSFVEKADRAIELIFGFLPDCCRKDFERSRSFTRYETT